MYVESEHNYLMKYVLFNAIKEYKRKAYQTMIINLHYHYIDNNVGVCNTK